MATIGYGIPADGHRTSASAPGREPPLDTAAAPPIVTDDSARPSGKFIPCVEGGMAFIPNPLPPDIRWTPQLVKALSDADIAIGKLAAEGKRLPNPYALIRPYIRREAVLSSRIEGTQATLGELLAADAGLAVQRSPEDLREVANYVHALEHASRLRQTRISLSLVLELHENLMNGVRGNDAMPGTFRLVQNWVGVPGCDITTATHVPPPPQAMKECLRDWELFLADKSTPPLIQAALLHAQFETIHPFMDGNGRLGRLLIPLILIERGVLDSPLLYLSAFFEATKRDYYDALQAVRTHAKWEEWLAYFLNGVARQSEDAIGRSVRINDLLTRWRNMIADAGAKVPPPLLTAFAENPFWTVSRVAERMNVAFSTAQRAVDSLESLEILTRTSAAKRNRVYCATSILSILEEPPRINAWQNTHA